MYELLYWRCPKFQKLDAVKKDKNNKYSKFDTKFVIWRPSRNDMIGTLEKNKGTFLITKINKYQNINSFFWFHLFLEARAEILKKISLVFLP
jgi:hypothetical protein